MQLPNDMQEPRIITFRSPVRRPRITQKLPITREYEALQALVQAKIQVDRARRLRDLRKRHPMKWRVRLIGLVVGILAFLLGIAAGALFPSFQPFIATCLTVALLLTVLVMLARS